MTPLVDVTQASIKSIIPFVRHDPDCHVTHEGNEAPCSCGARVALLAFQDALTRLTAEQANAAEIAELTALLREMAEAVDGLPVEEWVEADRHGNPELLGYVMQAQGEWDRVRKARQKADTILSNKDDQHGSAALRTEGSRHDG